MQTVYSAEELILNESFVNYCYLGNAEDVSRWEKYLLQYPFEKRTVDEARSFVLGLKSMLKGVEKEKELAKFKNALNERGFADANSNKLNVAYLASENFDAPRKLRFLWYAAASVFVIAIVVMWSVTRKTDQRLAANENQEKITNLVLAENSVTKTGIGERKVVFLPDGTKVTMNVKTILTVDSSFGMNVRLVKLDGEAFFDVEHDARSPFIVQLKDFNIRVLGTMFNVRSYSGDKNSETALVKGEVEITLKNNSERKFLLKPNEKAVLPNTNSVAGSLLQQKSRTKAMQPVNFEIKPLTISRDGNSIIETGWMQNRLEINDETFVELKNKLERWYGVTIKFQDEEVKQYRFTATFEKENIDQALKAMQLSYQFKFTKNDNEIMIQK